MGVSENTFEEWYAIAIDAVEHRDAGSAYQILRTMDNFIATLDSTTRENEEFLNEVSILRRQLEYVAFPELPLDQACRILSLEIVSFVTSGINLDSQLSVRYDFTTYGEHERERMTLKKAILSNTEKIGTLGIGEWLQLFDASFDPETREDRSILDFFTREQRIVNLSRREQEILRVVLNVYEHWLAVEHLSLIDIANIYGQSSDNDFLPSQSVRQVALSYEKNTPPQENVIQKEVPNESLPLLKALGKFEKLGGQQVTNSKIVVKGQNDPVRPTIFNWLRAYRDELGVGAHDAVARGQFLFHSLNGKGLSFDERDQVGMLLKSLDENVPLTIDAGRQEVLFQRQRTESREQKIPNTKYQIPNEERPLPRQGGGVSAVREQEAENSGLTAPERLPASGGERPLFTNQDSGNISRAVFEMPHINQQTTGSREQITDNSQQITGSREQGALPHSLGTESLAGRQEIPNTIRQMTDQMPNRPSAFEQAKAIQDANRGARLSISNMNAETVELGKMETSREESRSAVAPLKSGTTAPNLVVPAPRAISFEPAKIDNFSFGASDQKTFSNSGRTAPKAERPLQAQSDRTTVVQEDFRPNFAPRDDMNVSSLSFSTNHVMPAEKERIREQRSENREQVESRTAVAPLKSGTTVIRDQTVAQQPLPIPTPVKKTPTAPVAPSKPPVNRFRITPTGHRDEAASDDTPSPHVVDLRG